MDGGSERVCVCVCVCVLWGEVSEFFFAGGGSEEVCGGVSVRVEGLKGCAWAVK